MAAVIVKPNRKIAKNNKVLPRVASNGTLISATIEPTHPPAK